MNFKEKGAPAEGNNRFDNLFLIVSSRRLHTVASHYDKVRVFKTLKTEDSQLVWQNICLAEVF